MIKGQEQLTIFTKSSVMDIRQSPKYASELHYKLIL